MNGSIYLIQVYPGQPRPVYKIGKTTRPVACRLKEYKSALHAVKFTCECTDQSCHDVEKQILTEFMRLFSQRRDLGTEYFEGDCDEMVFLIKGLMNVSDDCDTGVENKLLGASNETQQSTEIVENIKIYTCKRCGYIASTKGNLLQHLRRKKPCIVSKENISIEDYISELTHMEYNEVTYDCQFCNRKFNTPQGRSRHKKVCKMAPKENEVVRLRAEVSRLKRKIELMKKTIHTVTDTTTINERGCHSEVSGTG